MRKVYVDNSHLLFITIFKVKTLWHGLFSFWFNESKSCIQDATANQASIEISKISQFFHQDLKFFINNKFLKFLFITGNEPSDSIRVVNAVLTEIDQIRRYSNVLILTTSNMTGAIDLAFVDRADIKQYIGLPNSHAIYQIYYSCLQELMRVNHLFFI